MRLHPWIPTTASEPCGSHIVVVAAENAKRISHSSLRQSSLALRKERSLRGNKAWLPIPLELLPAFAFFRDGCTDPMGKRVLASASPPTSGATPQPTLVWSRTGAVARRSALGCLQGFPLRAQVG